MRIYQTDQFVQLLTDDCAKANANNNDNDANHFNILIARKGSVMKERKGFFEEQEKSCRRVGVVGCDGALFADCK
jgi:hypothetical protein